MNALSQIETSEPGMLDSRPRAERLEQMLRDNLPFVWRLARHLGVPDSDADDIAQRVMMVAASRFDDIEPGKERAFLFRTTMHATSKHRRTWLRRREVVTDQFEDEHSHQPAPDELVEKRRACADLRRVLQGMPEKLRTVFILYELEGWTLIEIGTAQSISQFTVASRLRRARAQFARNTAGLKRRLKGDFK